MKCELLQILADFHELNIGWPREVPSSRMKDRDVIFPEIENYSKFGLLA